MPPDLAHAIDLEVLREDAGDLVSAMIRTCDLRFRKPIRAAVWSLPSRESLRRPIALECPYMTQGSPR